MDEFFDIYITPYVEYAPIKKHRDMIRDNKHLNKLLYDNIHGLRLIYEKQKESNHKFTMKSAKKIFGDLEHPDVDYILTPEMVEECFLWSMMTVTDETNKIKKYEYLLFVEFLEFLCRVAIVGLDYDDQVEYKVHLLMQLLYDKMYEMDEMNVVDYPLMAVDEKYRH